MPASIWRTFQDDATPRSAKAKATAQPSRAEATPSRTSWLSWRYQSFYATLLVLTALAAFLAAGFFLRLSFWSQCRSITKNCVNKEYEAFSGLLCHREPEMTERAVTSPRSRTYSPCLVTFRSPPRWINLNTTSSSPVAISHAEKPGSITAGMLASGWDALKAGGFAAADLERLVLEHPLVLRSRARLATPLGQPLHV